MTYTQNLNHLSRKNLLVKCQLYGELTSYAILSLRNLLENNTRRDVAKETISLWPQSTKVVVQSPSHFCLKQDSSIRQSLIPDSLLSIIKCLRKVYRNMNRDVLWRQHLLYIEKWILYLWLFFCDPVPVKPHDFLWWRIFWTLWCCLVTLSNS